MITSTQKCLSQCEFHMPTVTSTTARTYTGGSKSIRRRWYFCPPLVTQLTRFLCREPGLSEELRRAVRAGPADQRPVHDPSRTDQGASLLRHELGGRRLDRLPTPRAAPQAGRSVRAAPRDFLEPILSCLYWKTSIVSDKYLFLFTSNAN